MYSYGIYKLSNVKDNEAVDLISGLNIVSQN